jgi:Ger(x)C family germination protein
MKHESIVKNTKSLPFFFCFLLVFILSFALTGCSDMVEIQDRDFVLALGISYSDRYQVTYALPNLDYVTGQSKAGENEKFVRTFQGNSLPEIEELYDMNSEKALDYRHLQAIILDKSMFLHQEKLDSFLKYIDENYTISRNVLIYYAKDDADKLIKSNGTLGGSIGDYLKKLDKNNINKEEPAALGDLMNTLDNTKTIVIPVIQGQNDSVSLEGAVLYQKGLDLEFLTEEERKLYNILLGNGTDYIFNINGTAIRLKKIESRKVYDYENREPVVTVKLRAEIEYLQYSSSDEPETIDSINQVLEDKIMNLINIHVKQEKFDLLNLYETSSYRKPDIWLDYENRMDSFIDDVMIRVNLLIE